ncbi:hypothetical protein T11_10425 [Trichinella zimbabwensis]|uniref:Uncharacterized protein n=1 Tax=Trichinella zimbabwensis TaxID=268475 RepID=A0A0V1H320_9BILA|nr:hypothetical protein T11_10425 [Trichinella zimbabwensis]
MTTNKKQKRVGDVLAMKTFGSCQFESLHRKASDFEKASDGRFYLTVIKKSNSPCGYCPTTTSLM